MQPLVLGWLKTFLIYDTMLANEMIYNDMIYTYKWLEYLLCSLRKSFIRLQRITIFERRCKHQAGKWFLIKLQNMTINLLSSIFSGYTLMPLGFSFIHCFLTFTVCMNREGLVLFCRPFLENWYKRKRIKRENRHLWIIQEMIYIMELSLKIVRKTRITFVLSKRVLFFFEK